MNYYYVLFERLTAIFLLLFVYALAGNAQEIVPRVIEADSSLIHVLKTKREDILIGHFQKISEDSIYFQTLNSSIQFTFHEDEVASIRLFDSSDYKSSAPQSLAVPKGLHRSNLFSTAIGIPRGTLEYRNAVVIFNQLTYAPADYMSTSLSILTPPNSGGMIASLDLSFNKSWKEWFHTKVSLKTAGTLFDNQADGIIMFHPHFTLGNTKINFTAGYLFSVPTLDGAEQESLSLVPISLYISMGDHWNFKLDYFKDLSEYILDTEAKSILPALSHNTTVGRFEFGVAAAIYGSDVEAGIPFMSYTRIIRNGEYRVKRKSKHKQLDLFNPML